MGIRGFRRWTMGALVALFAVAGCSDPPTKDGSNNGSNNGGSNNGGSNNGGSNNGGSNNGGSNNGGSNNGSNNGGGPGLCAGATAPPADADTCHADNECAEGTCSLSSGGACFGGFACGPSQLCSTDSDCADGAVCQKYTSEDPCCGTFHDNTQCSEPCTVGSCPDGEVCSDTGHCEPQSCEDGYGCPEFASACAPGRETADRHGCAIANCVEDGYECPDGTTCQADSRYATKCEPIHCSEPGGLPCYPNYRCEESSGGWGCVKMQCESDADCDCGACVSRFCEPHIGVCVGPQPG